VSAALRRHTEPLRASGRTRRSVAIPSRCARAGPVGLWFTALPRCTHLDSVKVLELPDSVAGCEDCLREGGVWLHLRICLECGHVGCCDDSPNRHATAHHHSSGHPLIRSLEPGEEWSWCFVDEIGMLIPDVHGHPRIPPSPMLTN
jgi:hypothetical protein